MDGRQAGKHMIENRLAAPSLCHPAAAHSQNGAKPHTHREDLHQLKSPILRTATTTFKNTRGILLESVLSTTSYPRTVVSSHPPTKCPPPRPSRPPRSLARERGRYHTTQRRPPSSTQHTMRSSRGRYVDTMRALYKAQDCSSTWTVWSTSPKGCVADSEQYRHARR